VLRSPISKVQSSCQYLNFSSFVDMICISQVFGHIQNFTSIAELFISDLIGALGEDDSGFQIDFLVETMLHKPHTHVTHIGDGRKPGAQN
jgi:hypothetical protein